MKPMGIIITLITTSFLSGCSVIDYLREEPKFILQKVEPNQTIVGLGNSTAARRIMYGIYKNHELQLCAENLPDVGSKSSIKFEGGTPSETTQLIKLINKYENAKLFERYSTVELSKSLLFSLCQFGINYKLDKAEVIELMKLITEESFKTLREIEKTPSTP